MLNLKENRWLRLAFLCCMYLAQGLPYGFVTVGLRDYFHGEGATAGQTGTMIAMVSIPWTFKFIWGPVIDRWGIHSMGKRRPWLILAQGLMVVTIVILAFVPETRSNLTLLGWGILILNIFIALQDVSTDSLTVDLVPEKERARANGMMFGSSYLGTSLGAAGIGWFLPNPDREWGSVPLAFFVLAGIVFLIMQLPLLIRERKGEKLLPWTSGSNQLEESEKPAGSLQELFLLLRSAFSRPVAIFAAVFTLFVQCANVVLSTVSSEFFVKEIGWKSAAYTQMESIGNWLSFSGCLLAGLLADRIGVKRGVLISGIILGFLWISFRFCGAFYHSVAFVYTFQFSQSVLLGFMSVSMFSLFMAISNKRVAATQFTTYMALLNLSTVIGGKAIGSLTEAIPSIPDLFVVCGMFHIGVMVFLAVSVHPFKRDLRE